MILHLVSLLLMVSILKPGSIVYYCVLVFDGEFTTTSVIKQKPYNSFICLRRGHGKN